jgi:hypothetical protein
VRRSAYRGLSWVLHDGRPDVSRFKNDVTVA